MLARAGSVQVALPRSALPDVYKRQYLFHAADGVGAVTAKSSKGPLWSALSYQQGTPLSALPAGMNTLSLDGATAAVSVSYTHLQRVTARDPGHRKQGH